MLKGLVIKPDQRISESPKWLLARSPVEKCELFVRRITVRRLRELDK